MRGRGNPGIRRTRTADADPLTTCVEYTLPYLVGDDRPEPHERCVAKKSMVRCLASDAEASS